MAADWAVAAGTGALALATFWLAWQARKEAATVREQVTLQAEQLAASERPAVYPITPHDWSTSLGDGGRWLAFRNGGTGIARNVQGRIWWHVEGGEARLLGQTLGAGDHARLWLDGQKGIARWFGAEGYVVYEDVRGVEWQSRFRYEHSGGQVWARLLAWERSSELDDPELAFPREGWADEELPDEPEPVRYRQF
jgi:hypothetical protein